MKVFNLYFKILKSLWLNIVIYSAIFIAFVLMNFASSGSQDNFTLSKTNIIVFDYDNTEISKNFYNYLDRKTNIVKVEDEIELTDKYLFFNKAAMVVRINKGFSDKLVSNNSIELLSIKKINQNLNGEYGLFIITRYFEILNLHDYNNFDEVNKILDDEIKVSFIDDNTKDKTMSYYFNGFNYVLFTVSILIIGLTTRAVNEPSIKRRNQVSPLSTKKFNLYISLGNILLLLVLWLIFSLLSYGLYNKEFSSNGGFYYLLNTLVFLIPVYLISFLIGNYIKSDEGINALGNVIGLGSSFLCGAFVPQEYLPEGVLNASRVFPTYWFVRNNNLISSGDFGLINLLPLFIFVFIFISGYLFIGYFVKKKSII